MISNTKTLSSRYIRFFGILFAFFVMIFSYSNNAYAADWIHLTDFPDIGFSTIGVHGTTTLLQNPVRYFISQGNNPIANWQETGTLPGVNSNEQPPSRPIQSHTFGGLTPGQTYIIVANSTNNQNEVISDSMSVTTSSIAQIGLVASDETDTSVTISVSPAPITYYGVSNIVIKILDSTGTVVGTPATVDVTAGEAFDPQDFDGLTECTDYIAQAYITIGSTHVFGSVDFSTTGDPTVEDGNCPTDDGGGDGDDDQVPGGGNNSSGGGLPNPIRYDTLSAFLKGILDIVLTIGVPIVALAIIYSGFLFVKAQGNASELETAKQTFIYTIIGAAILLGSWILAEAINATVTALQ